MEGLTMRLEPIAPQDLTSTQKSLYLDMRKGIAGSFNAFKSERADGALIGPWNPWLHEPDIGKAIWDLTLALTASAVLPDNVRQVVILTVGAHFNAAYEIYAHIAIAETEDLAPEQRSSLMSGIKPAGLTREEGVAYDAAFALCRGGVLPEPVYRLAVGTFGQHGANELFYLVSLYALVCINLNAFNVPVPERP
jgi:4-carboxymuconolactone decarboxylase